MEVRVLAGGLETGSDPGSGVRVCDELPCFAFKDSWRVSGTSVTDIGPAERLIPALLLSSLSLSRAETEPSKRYQSKQRTLGLRIDTGAYVTALGVETQTLTG